MPRSPRRALAHHVYHVVNRGALKQRLFAEEPEYRSFRGLLRRARRQAPVDIYAYCLMPNHWHLIVRPESTPALSAYMHWVTMVHATQFREQTSTRGLGHVYQGRFVSVPICDERQFASTLLYVEANPLRAKLVDRAERWPWSSLAERLAPRRADGVIVNGPWTLPANWVDIVNELGRDVDGPA